MCVLNNLNEHFSASNTVIIVFSIPPPLPTYMYMYMQGLMGAQGPIGAKGYTVCYSCLNTEIPRVVSINPCDL